MSEFVAQNYYNLGGTIRSLHPQETLARIKPYFKSLGITRVANVTGLDTIGIPTFICIRPNSKHLSVSQGKGLTNELAQVSAVMEAIESYHAENPKSPDFLGSFNELCNQYPLVDPQIFSQGFFNPTKLTTRKIGWIKAKNLLTQQDCFLPHSLINLNSSVLRNDHGFFDVSSNGLASGNCLAEAICHGLYEVIERNAVYSFNYCEPKKREELEVDLTTIKNSQLVWLLECFQRANIAVKVWEITGSIGIPTFGCQIEANNELRWLGKFFGSGTHLSKEVALARALTEAAQSRLTLISGSRDDVFPERYYARVADDKVVAAVAQSQMHPQNSVAKKDFAICVEPEFQANFVANLQQLLLVLQQNGYSQIYLVEHTKPEFNIAVVQVFVVGMQYKCN